MALITQKAQEKSSYGERNHYEYIDIPMIISPKIKKNIKRNICDSMGMTATFLDLLQVPLDKSFKGEVFF